MSTSVQKSIFSSLCKMVESGDSQGLQAAHRNGLDMKIRSEKGNTILHIAVMHRQAQMVQWILEQQAVDLNALNKDRNSPLLLAFKAFKGAFLFSPRCRELIAVLVQAGANVNHVNLAGERPLPIALAKNMDQEAELLFMHGADLTFRDCNGRTVELFARDYVSSKVWKTRRNEQELRQELHVLAREVSGVGSLRVGRRI